MYKSNSRLGIGGVSVDGAKSLLGYAETDPSARYGRFKEVLGKGAMKTVYRAFDNILGMEVAWNQVKLNDVFRSPDELDRLYSEVHLLKNLNHESIIKFYTSWIDIDRRTFNFITEMFTSGNLSEYKQKYQNVDIRAIKNWARQILRGLAYLHGHGPPVIHRDLKCDNIFVNGHLGQVKIGDLGFAAVLRGSQHAHSVIGTPEFMAPELYEESYDELVDIYSFGMCMLEMLTSEYPYSECSNPAQIYKKVTLGMLPEAFYRIKEAEAQEFVGKCLATASKRLPAKGLLSDPFLAVDEGEPTIPRVVFRKPNGPLEDIFPSMLANHTKTTDMTITGTMNSESNTIFLKVQMSDKDGRARNIYFPFDIKNDTAIDVAVEMVKELEINYLEPLEISEMIEQEISSLIPGRKQLGLSKIFYQQHSFSYEDADEDFSDGVRPPFYAASSCSSTFSSLLAFNSHIEARTCCGAFSASNHSKSQGGLLINEDASSESSFNSFKYSNLNYYSGSEDDLVSPRNLVSSRRQSSTGQGHKHQQQIQLDPVIYGTSKAQRKLNRIHSLMDVCSQLLHRSLMEQIKKKRLFKTVGAVEHIGFHEPHLPDNGWD